ncbi:TonB-dependent receptor [Mucilaginibacter sp. BJC16-A38]|uniref:outer membrane beta-barrel family protein n=1 Tax=Mucilaginibacter phenanthrenivorans TaxID=1234842 RepID=UPI0021582CC7|nr:outer membrane beta-barrel family protein [Mucilaginibacter phenanthrenivorans]MCR8561837.1 TonB-dependent receptor [Mucilaginibacter phenanthrenivorans]
MKHFLLIALCCFLSIAALAQTTPKSLTVKGTAIDSVTNKPLGYVTVALQDAATKKSVRGGLTKDDGTFELKAEQGKAYQLTLASVGYRSKVVKVTGRDEEINVGNIILLPAKNQLKEISITAVRPLVKQEIDRISYDVQADPETKTQNVLDMLRKVPLITVDASDNIQLKGEGNYKILINGKPSSLVAHNPSDVFKSMPASSIQKIEVITTPPAKYDAEGLAGIINIITNKKIDQGYNGSINMRYNSLFGPGAGLQLTVKQGKLGISNYTGYGDQIKRRGSSRSTRQTYGDSATYLTQASTNVNSGRYIYTSTEISYEIDSLNLITAGIDYNNGHNNGENDQFSQQFNHNNLLNQSYRLSNTSASIYKGVDFGINYQLGFKHNKDRLLTLSYKYSNQPNSSTTTNTITDRFDYAQPGYLQRNDARTQEQTIQADYVHPLKKITIEGGFKAILRNSSSNFGNSNFIDSTQTYVVDPASTNNFKYNQDVYSLYNTYQYNLNNWGVKAGFRVEATDITAHFISEQSDVDRNYSNFVPSISIQRKLKNNSSFTFGFTNRIQRPNIYELNPFIDRTNPKFISTGNPDLKPVLNHTFELNYSKFSKGSFNFGMSYSFSNNAIQSVSRLVDTVTYTRNENVGSNRNLGFNISMNYPITKKLNLNINTRIAQIWLKGYFDNQLYSNNGLQGNVFGYAGYRITDTWRAGVNAGFSSAYVSLQGKSSSYVFTSVSTSRDILNKKGSIFFNVNNPLTKYRKTNNYTRDPDFYQTSVSEFPFRSFNVGFNYRFGKLKAEIKKNQRGINNDDTKGTTAPASGK